MEQEKKNGHGVSFYLGLFGQKDVNFTFFSKNTTHFYTKTPIFLLLTPLTTKRR